MVKLHRGIFGFQKWLGYLFRQPIFIFVTLWGHAAIFFGAVGFYRFEGAAKGLSLFDSYYWAISMATTIGSEHTPSTVGGKIVGILMMVVGALFLWSYTALFAASFVEADVEKIEREIKVDEETLHKLVREVEALHRAIKASK